jgi:hypothetical protein
MENILELNSPYIDNVASALIGLHKNYGKEIDPTPFLKKAVFHKTGKESYEHDYVDLKPYLDAINPVLSKCDLTVTRLFYGSKIVLQLMHKSGQFVRSIADAYKPGDTAQYKGAQVTMISRYQLLGLLNIDDGTMDTDGADGDKLIHAKDHNDLSGKLGDRSTEKAEDAIREHLPIPPVVPRSEEQVKQLMEDIGEIILKKMKYDKRKYKNGVDHFIEYAPADVLKASYDAAVLIMKKKENK